MPRMIVQTSLAVVIALGSSIAWNGPAAAQDQPAAKPAEIVAPAETQPQVAPAAPSSEAPSAAAMPSMPPASTDTAPAAAAPSEPAAASSVPTAAPAADVAPAPAPAAMPVPAPTPAPAPAAAEVPAAPAPAPVDAAAPPPVVAPAAPPPVVAPPAPPPPPVVAPPAPVPSKAAAPAPERVVLAARPVLSLAGSGAWEEAEDRLGAAFEQLAAAAKKVGVKPTGAPLVQYVESDEDRFSFVAMLPVDKRPKGKLPKGIKAETSPSGPALRFSPSAVGDDLEEVYGRIDDHIVAQGLTLATMIEEFGEDAIVSPEDRAVVQIYVFVE